MARRVTSGAPTTVSPSIARTISSNLARARHACVDFSTNPSTPRYWNEAHAAAMGPPGFVPRMPEEP
jgi:hypothetical protein